MTKKSKSKNIRLDYSEPPPTPQAPPPEPQAAAASQEDGATAAPASSSQPADAAAVVSQPLPSASSTEVQPEASGQDEVQPGAQPSEDAKRSPEEIKELFAKVEALQKELNRNPNVIHGGRVTVSDGLVHHENRDMVRLLDEIRKLEENGYCVELNFHMNEYAIFAGKPELENHVGYLIQELPGRYQCLDDVSVLMAGKENLDINSLVSLMAAGTPPTIVVVPGGRYVSTGVRMTHLNERIISRCGYKLLRLETNRTADLLFFKSGHFVGGIRTDFPGEISCEITGPRHTYLTLAELDIVWNPMDLRESDLFAFSVRGFEEYRAYYLPKRRVSVVWKWIQYPKLGRKLKLLGFANSTPDMINVERDYFCTLPRSGNEKNADYPIGLPVYAWRQRQLPKKKVEQPDEPVALKKKLQDQGVEHTCKWSVKDGMYNILETKEGLGGLVFENDTDYFFAWDGVKNYLVKYMSVAEVIRRHKEAKPAAPLPRRLPMLPPVDLSSSSSSESSSSESEGEDAFYSADDEVPVLKALYGTENAFGKDTFFVGEANTPANPGDPRTWPKNAFTKLRRGSYRYDRKSGNIEYKHDQRPEFMLESSRFYNKQKCRNCYVISVKKLPDGDQAPPLDELLWTHGKDKSEESALASSLHYKRKELETNSTSAVLEFDLSSASGRKFIANSGNKAYYLSVIPATDNSTLTIKGAEASSCHMVMVGAANTAVLNQYKIDNIKRQNENQRNVALFQGIDLGPTLLAGAVECETVDRLARTTDSYGHCTMWKLTRDVTDTSTTALTIRDIGIRKQSGDVSKFAGSKSQAEKNSLGHIRLVRCFVAYVPDVKDDPKVEGGQVNINVVSVQNVHPVEGELHIVYLLHHTGKFYSQQIYSSVILLHVPLSGDFIDRFVKLCNNPTARILPVPAESANPVGSQAIEATAIRVRGYYNEFWKNVCDPTRNPELAEEETELYRNWQHFYQHDFLGVNYLASPLNNYSPEEIHVVRVSDMIFNNFSTNSMCIGTTENRGEKVFLSGAFDKSQSFIGSPFVEYKHYLVQVEVPDEDKIKCIIYDFAGMDSFSGDAASYDRTSELKSKAIFSEMGRLEMKGAIPQRLYFSDIKVGDLKRTFSFNKSIQQEDKEKKILKACPTRIRVKSSEADVEKEVETHGCIQLNLFYFVSHVGIEKKLKVGVANVPFNCRSFVTHSESLCKHVLDVKQFKVTEAANTTSQRNQDVLEHCITDYTEDTKGKAKVAKDEKYPVRGCLWQEGSDQIVGIVDGKSLDQVLAHASLFKNVGSSEIKTKVAFVGKEKYHDMKVQQPWMKQDKVVGYWNTPGVADKKYLELTHYVRQISSPIFDVAKGYPVHGFYKLHAETSGINYDPVFYKMFDTFYSFWMHDEHPKHPDRKAKIAGDRKRMHDEGEYLKQRVLGQAGRPSRRMNTDYWSDVAAIVSTSAALYMLL
ncbi:hypothetical protein HDE_03536 [Halotydeus destructor]|nr:hypothetical protein HDE_03536 [Halotydeus destructor]